MTDQTTSAFEKSLRGRLVHPTDADYDTVRALYNGMIDKRPRLIARCVDVADVKLYELCARRRPAAGHPGRRTQRSRPWQLQ
jgi:hypothetical protein